MNDSLKKLFLKIENPLSYEPKNGYHDSTVIGGFSKFALNLVAKELENVTQNETKNILLQLKDLLEQYQTKPDIAHYQSLFQFVSGRQSTKMPYSTKASITQKISGTLISRNELTRPVQFLPGVGPKRSLQLHRLGLFTLYDLLYYFPRDYLDRSSVLEIGKAQSGTFQTFMGKIAKVQESYVNRYLILKVIVFDKTGMLVLVFFNQKFLKKTFEENIGKIVIFSGKVDFRYQYYEINSPEYEILEEEKETIQAGRIVPVYRLTTGLRPKWFRQLIWKTLEQYNQYLYDFLPAELLEKKQWMSRQESIFTLHFPETFEKQEKARQRIVFDEFLFGQYQARVKKNENHHHQGHRFSVKESDLDVFRKSLPFTLTETQNHALTEMIRDLNAEYPMNRLLHGDVGSGKTVVAAAMLFLAFIKGFQSALMAPTEILARQSYQFISSIMEHFQVKTALLISDLKEKEKKALLEKIEHHEIDIVVSTHAVIQEAVKFDSLGLIIVDEQHRFGVLQRSMLREKGVWPHTLVMSATPIPRTIALSRYGDLDVSVLSEMPGGCRQVTTRIIHRTRQEEAYNAIQKELENGNKAFLICPLIEESSKIQAENSIQKSEEMKTLFPKTDIFLLHGRLTAEEKEQVMKKFKEIPSALLVSTTVVEVGIDIPEATIIVIENAERFGLAQLHQLRGRVGRKSQQSYCWLIVENENAMEKLSIMEKTNSGFSIAEEDLQQRGPGELFGERQSGFFHHSMIQLEKDAVLIEEAKQLVASIKEESDFWKTIKEEIEFRKPFLDKRNLQDIG